MYAARFRIDARQEVKDARVVLDAGWADGYTVNGQAPQPLTQASADGKLSFGFGHIPAGRHLTFFLSLQVNPTNVVALGAVIDGDQHLVTIHRTITIFP